MFPTRMNLGTSSAAAAGNDKMLQQQMKEIKNIFRRVYRIFAHAWFQHRDMFWRVESRTGLYVFFKMVCDEYGIIESENYTIPVEAEGVEPEHEQKELETQAPNLLRRDPNAGLGLAGEDNEKNTPTEPMSLGDTTKRHRHTISDYSNAVNTVIQEEAEEEDQLLEKPSLGRQPTALKDSDEESTDLAADQTQDEDPAPGIARSDTLRPTKNDEDDEEENEETVLEPSLDEKGVEASDDQEIEEEKPQDQPPAEADDASKTVGD